MDELQKAKALVQWYSSQMQAREFEYAKLFVENSFLQAQNAELQKQLKEAHGDTTVSEGASVS
jgi:hypothetical protein